MCFKINGKSGQYHKKKKKDKLSVMLKIYQEQHKKIHIYWIKGKLPPKSEKIEDIPKKDHRRHYNPSKSYP